MTHKDPVQRHRIEMLTDAMMEAQRFYNEALEAVNDLHKRSSVEPSKAYASAKRASMDLSNALVKVRKRYE